MAKTDTANAYEIDSGTVFCPDSFLRLASSGSQVRISAASRERIANARQTVDACIRRRTPVYGLNTGLGALVGQRTDQAELKHHQRRILVGRACGAGPPLPRGIARAALLARIISMAKGASGVHPGTLDHLVAFYNAGVEPVIPKHGSIGAGDLVANAHLALPLIGLGEVWSDGNPVPAEQRLRSHGLSACELHEMDAMALINHHCTSAAAAAVTVRLADMCITEALYAAVLSFEGFAANRKTLSRKINELRPAPGQRKTAKWLRVALKDSRQPSRRIQDPLSYRLVAVIFGAAWDAARTVTSILRDELNGVTDSPVVLPEKGEVVSAPNFCNPGLNNALMLLGAALGDCARASVLRSQKLMQSELSGLPRCLSPAGGVSAGMVPLQKTANALLLDVYSLAQPVLVPLPAVSESVEDMDSSVINTASRLRQLVKSLRRLSGLEALFAAQAMDLRASQEFSTTAKQLRSEIRKGSPMLIEDRSLAGDLESAAKALQGFAAANGRRRARLCQQDR